MTQYIDKAAVVTEIKKRIKYYQAKNQKWGVAGYAGRVAEGEEILDYLNTLEVKKVDLEKKINCEQSLPSNLDEAAEEYAFTNWEDNDYHEGASEGVPFDPIGYTEKVFKDGAKWMSNQLK